MCSYGRDTKSLTPEQPRLWAGAQIGIAAWIGFRFLDLTVSELRDAAPSPVKTPSDGTMMLKYSPASECAAKRKRNR